MPNHDLIARCEREAAAGRKPLLEWRKNFVGNESLAHPALSEPTPSINDSVSRDNPTVSLVVSDGSHKLNGWIGLRLATRDGAKLYAESQLREAAAPLFAAEIAKLTSDVEYLGAVLRRLVRDGFVTVAQVDHASAEIIGEEVDAMTPEQISAEVKASGIDIDRLVARTRAMLDAAKKDDANHAD